MSKETAGARITKARESLEMTQDDLEKKSGVTRRTIQNIEADRGDTRLSNMIAVAQTLSISLDYIAFGETPKPKITASDLSPEEFARAIIIAGQTSDPDKAELLSLIDKVPASRIRALIRRVEVFLKSSPDELQMPAPRRRVNRRKD